MENSPPVVEEKIELEDQFILRLPVAEAEYVRNILRTKPKKIQKRLKIDMDVVKGDAAVLLHKNILKGKLRKLPTVVESLKTHNKHFFVKTADICQLLDCTEKGAEEAKDMPHGLAPPLKNVKKRRFRKCLINKDESSIDLQKELFYLLQADLEAVSTKFQLIDDKKNDRYPSSSSTASGMVNEKSEIELFGNVLTDSETRHYTPLERTIFLECLKRHKDVIEARRSDSATLVQKDKAWSKVVAEFNNSRYVVQERSLSQLKKLWTNIKQGQRNAITKERQGRLATGGGPESASSNVDSDVAIIVPHLMETVPTAFSSNLQDFNEDIPELDRLENEISMLEKGTVRSDENARSEEEPEMSSEGEQMDGEVVYWK